MDTPRKWQVASLATAVAGLGFGGMLIGRPAVDEVPPIDLDRVTGPAAQGDPAPADGSADAPQIVEAEVVDRVTDEPADGGDTPTTVTSPATTTSPSSSASVSSPDDGGDSEVAPSQTTTAPAGGSTSTRDGDTARRDATAPADASADGAASVDSPASVDSDTSVDS